MVVFVAEVAEVMAVVVCPVCVPHLRRRAAAGWRHLGAGPPPTPSMQSRGIATGQHMHVYIYTTRIQKSAHTCLYIYIHTHTHARTQRYVEMQRLSCRCCSYRIRTRSIFHHGRLRVSRQTTPLLQGPIELHLRRILSHRLLLRFYLVHCSSGSRFFNLVGFPLTIFS